MKISNLTEMATPACMPDNNTSAPKFGRSDEMLESGVGTSTAGGITSVSKPMGKMRTRGQGSMFKGISTSSKYANSAKAGISEDSVNEDELSEEQLQAKQRREENFKKAKDRELGNKPKSRDIMAKEAFNGEYDDEAGMADNNLETMRRAVDGIDNVIHTGDNLPEWCQEKIAVAKSMLVNVWDYMRSEEEIQHGKEVDEGEVYDLGREYGADAPPRRPLPSGGSMPRRHDDEPDFMDPDQRRLRAEQERLKKANAEYYAKKNQGVAEGSDNRLPQDTLDLIDEYIAKVEPYADRNEMIQDVVRGTIHTSELEYALQEGVAEGLNEFAPDGFNGGDDGEEFNPRMAKMAYDAGSVKGVSLADGATLARAMAITEWDKQDGGIYTQHFAKGFKAGRMNKINHDNKQYNLNLKLMKDGSIRRGQQGVAEDTIDMPFGSISGKDVDIGLQHRSEQTAYTGLKRLGLVDTSEQFLTLQEIAKLVTDTSNIHIFAFDSNPVRSYVKLIKMIGWDKDNPTEYEYNPQGVSEEKQRLDPSCWKGYRKSGTKMKGNTRVNNCVPVKESAILQGMKK
jgi:hypothetical protein